MSEKPFACDKCGRRFATNQGRNDHFHHVHEMRPVKKAKRHRPWSDNKTAAFETWQDVTADMSDGTAFAMLGQFGLTMDDVAVEAERQNAERNVTPNPT